MTEKKWTPEPWVVTKDQRHVYANQTAGGVCNLNGFDNREGNSARIVDCVNGCRHIPDPKTTIPKMVEALREHDYLDLPQCVIDVLQSTINDESEVGDG